VTRYIAENSANTLRAPLSERSWPLVVTEGSRFTHTIKRAIGSVPRSTNPWLLSLLENESKRCG
jgi:hypothetical protein